MAEAVTEVTEKLKPDWIKNSSNLEAQKEELEVLNSFFENTNNMDLIEEAARGESVSTEFVIEVITRL